MPQTPRRMRGLQMLMMVQSRMRLMLRVVIRRVARVMVRGNLGILRR
jgi:hypothetical protein